MTVRRRGEAIASSWAMPLWATAGWGWGDWALRLGRASANAVRLAMPTGRRLARFMIWADWQGDRYSGNSHRYVDDSPSCAGSD